MAVNTSYKVQYTTNLYCDALVLSEDALLVAFFPGKKLYFCGNVWLKLIVGSVCVHGYTFEPGDLYPVFSPPSHSLLSVDVLEGKKIKQFTLPALEDLEIPNDWVQQLTIDQNCSIAIVKFCRFESNSTRLFEASEVLHKCNVPVSSNKLFEDKLGIRVVDESLNVNKYHLKQESPAWNLYANSILQNIPNDPRVVVAGGKGVGKTTFFTYLINKLLSNHSVDHVACVDLDPGQPEFSLPSVLSITRISDPVLGPSFTHIDGMNLSDQTQIVVGDISVRNVVPEYLSIVKSLESIYTKKYSSIPLIINTMGYTDSTGLDIMVNVLRIFNPSHVIVIESMNSEFNYACSLSTSFVNSYNRGILENISSTPLSYELRCMRSFLFDPPKIYNLQLRDLRILSYLSKLWKDQELVFIGENCKSSIKVPWSCIAVYLVGSDLPQKSIFDSINASLVALCNVEEKYLKDIGSNLPRQIKKNSLWHNTSTCLGWGVVEKIDPLSKVLHILTPLSDTLLMMEVNMFVLTKTCLPVYFSNLFSKCKFQ